MKHTVIYQKSSNLFKNKKNKKQEYLVKNTSIRFFDIPMSIFLVIKKYGWAVFFYKLTDYIKLFFLKYLKELKGLYSSVLFSYKRDGLKNVLLRSLNYVFYGKGVVSRREIIQRRKVSKVQASHLIHNMLKEVNGLLDYENTVILIAHDATRTGVPMLTLNIAKTLNVNFNKKIISVFFQGGPLEEEFKKYGTVINLSHISLNSMTKKEQETVDCMFKNFSGFGINKCICNTVLGGMLMPFINKYKFSCINLVHEQSETIKEHDFIEATENVLRYSDKIVFSSNFVRDDFARNFKKFEKEIFVRPQGIYQKNAFKNEKEKARRMLREKLGLRETAKIIFGCGFANMRKGADLFFEIASQILNENKEMQYYFIWLGEWDKSLKDKMIKMSKEKEFYDRMILIDFEKDPSLFFAGADVFLLPSRQDPFPSVVLNAMDCGTPVIAFDGAGGVSEILLNQQGMLVPYLDIFSMKMAIVDLLKNKELYKIIARKSMEAIEGRFVFENYVKFLLEQIQDDKKDGVSSMEEKKVDISVVFLTCNGLENNFDETLKMVKEQKTDLNFEIIVIDSGSIDGTVEFIKKQGGIRLYEVPNHEFGHGRTRQLGAVLSKGSLVIFLTQDATPVNNNWIQNLIKSFSDADVVGACSRIIPRRNACLLKKIEVANDLSGRTDKIIAKMEDRNNFEKLSFSEKRSNYYFFNDIASCIRKSYLVENPFPDIFFAEDVEFAKIAIKNEKKIVFDPNSVVCHSHNYAIKQSYKRNFIDAKYHKKYLNIITVPTCKVLLKNVIFCVGRDLRESKKYNESICNKIVAMIYSPIIHLSEQLGQFYGSRFNDK